MIYSIGYGNRDVSEFIACLKTFDLRYLIDVRSKPFSKWKTSFNRDVIGETVRKFGIRYVFLGDKIGGIPSDKSCYDATGKVMYHVLSQKLFFRQGIERLVLADKKGIKVALMCGEVDPLRCHRSKLIGQELLKKGISLQHIVSQSRVKSQREVMYELTEGKRFIPLKGVY